MSPHLCKSMIIVVWPRVGARHSVWANVHLLSKHHLFFCLSFCFCGSGRPKALIAQVAPTFSKKHSQLLMSAPRLVHSLWPICYEWCPWGCVVVFVKCQQLVSQSDACSLKHAGWIKPFSAIKYSSARLVFTLLKEAGSRYSKSIGMILLRCPFGIEQHYPEIRELRRDMPY